MCITLQGYDTSHWIYREVKVKLCVGIPLRFMCVRRKLIYIYIIRIRCIFGMIAADSHTCNLTDELCQLSFFLTDSFFSSLSLFLIILFCNNLLRAHFQTFSLLSVTSCFLTGKMEKLTWDVTLWGGIKFNYLLDKRRSLL